MSPHLTFAAFALIAAFLFHLIPDMPLGTTPDESKKAIFVLKSFQDFSHPILLLQVVRIVNFFADHRDLDNIMALGRMVAAIFGGLFVFSTMLLASRFMSTAAALCAGILVAAAPLTTVHAQNFKEDIILAPMMLLSFLSLLSLYENRTLRSALIFGVFAGLTASAKYIGMVVIPLAFMLPLLSKPLSARSYYSKVSISVLIAVIVFTAVNWNMFLDLAHFASRFGGEVAKHVSTTGDRGYVASWMRIFTFYWTKYIVPGLQIPFAIAALASMLSVVWRWSSCPQPVRLLFAFALLWYGMHELSLNTQKAARHMTMMTGIFAILVVFVIERTIVTASPTKKLAALAILTFCLAAPAGWRSVQLALSVPHDTIIVTEAAGRYLNGKVIWPEIAPGIKRHKEAYSLQHLAAEGIDKAMEKYDFIVLREPAVDRILERVSYGNQPHRVNVSAEFLSQLRRRTGLLIESEGGWFSYRNVPMRIVTLKGDPQNLAAAMAAVARDYPVRLTYLPAL